MASRSFYCPKCQCLVDESEVDGEQVETPDGKVISQSFYHTVIRTLSVSGGEHHLTHPVIEQP